MHLRKHNFVIYVKIQKRSLRRLGQAKMAGILMGDDNPLNALIGKSAAEKALQPWWESIEDLLIYGLIGFGKSDSN